MNWEVPDDRKMMYNPDYNPIYFDKPTEDETKIWNASIGSVTREYFKNSVTANGDSIIHVDTPMTCGISYGMFAIYYLRQRNAKRREK